MSAAVLSLIEIILVAVSCTVTLVPAGLNWREPEPGAFPMLLELSCTVSVWFNETRPEAICSASAPSTNSLNCDARGRGVEESSS